MSEAQHPAKHATLKIEFVHAARRLLVKRHEGSYHIASYRGQMGASCFTGSIQSGRPLLSAHVLVSSTNIESHYLAPLPKMSVIVKN